MKKVILLGSSNDLVKNPRGHLIDDFDIIWRSNHTGHPDSILKYPEILGSKYGNWYIHDIPYSIFNFDKGIANSDVNISIINKYNMILHNLFDTEFEQLKRVGCTIRKEDPKTGGKFFKGIYGKCDKQKIQDIQNDNVVNSKMLFNSKFNNLYFSYLNWIKDCYNFLDFSNFFCAKPWDIKINLKKPPTQKPSSGMRMLVYLLKQYEHVHLIGFNGGSTGHWYTDKKINLNYDKNSDYITTERNRFGMGKHHLNAEFRFMKLLQSIGRVTIL